MATLPGDREAFLIAGLAATAALLSTTLLLACDDRDAAAKRGGTSGGLLSRLFAFVLPSSPAIPQSPPMPRERLLGLLKSAAIEAEAACAQVPRAMEGESAAAARYAMMGRQAPPPTPLPQLWTAIFGRTADAITIASGVKEDDAVAALRYWSRGAKDKEVRVAERKVLACHPTDGITEAAITTALTTTMDAEFALWVRAAKEVQEAGVAPFTEEYSEEVRAHVANLERKHKNYLADALISLGNPWTPPRARLWEAILVHAVTTDPSLRTAIDTHTARHERRIEALGVLGGSRRGDGDGDGGAGMMPPGMMMGGPGGDETAMLSSLLAAGGGGDGGMDPQLAAMLQQQLAAGGGDLPPELLAALQAGGR